MGEYISRIEVGGNTLNAMIHLPTQLLRHIVLKLAESLSLACSDPAAHGDNDWAAVAEFLYVVVAAARKDQPLETIFRYDFDVKTVTEALSLFEGFKKHLMLQHGLEKNFAGLNDEPLALWKVPVSS